MTDFGPILYIIYIMYKKKISSLAETLCMLLFFIYIMRMCNIQCIMDSSQGLICLATTMPAPGVAIRHYSISYGKDAVSLLLFFWGPTLSFACIFTSTTSKRTLWITSVITPSYPHNVGTITSWWRPAGNRWNSGHLKVSSLIHFLLLSNTKSMFNF